MAKRRRRSFSPKFKAEAVRLVLEEGLSIVQASRDLDLARSTLANWVKQAKSAWGKKSRGARSPHKRPADPSSTRFLLRVTSGPDKEAAITESEYRSYSAARLVLSKALEVEMMYDLVVSNYLEFEEFLHGETLVFIAREEDSYTSSLRIQLGTAVRMASLMTASRMYVEQVPRHVEACQSGAKIRVKALLAAQYGSRFEYRFMEALRNHTQHSGFPVHSTHVGGGWRDEQLVCEVQVSAERRHLQGLKKAVLDEIDGERVDLKPAVRRYVECLSTVHDAVRTMLTEPTGRARAKIVEAYERVGVSPREHLIAACPVQDDGSEKCLPLLLVWDDRRKDLAQRNRKLVNLDRIVIR